MQKKNHEIKETRRRSSYSSHKILNITLPLQLTEVKLYLGKADPVPMHVTYDFDTYAWQFLLCKRLHLSVDDQLVLETIQVYPLNVEENKNLQHLI